MWAVFGAVWAQKEPLAQNFVLHLLMVSLLGGVAAYMFVFRPAHRISMRLLYELSMSLVLIDELRLVYEAHNAS